jgi:hypothetical protein
MAMLRIYDYLHELSDDQINQLYGTFSFDDYSQSQWVCRAVYQSLHPLSRNFIMRLLFLNSPIHLNDLLVWYHPPPHDRTQFYLTLQELLKARILLPIPSSSPPVIVDTSLSSSLSSDQFLFNKGFRESMKYNLSGIHEPWAERKSDLTLLIVTKNAPTKIQLHEECIQKWNNILQFMITTDPHLHISDTVINYLLEAGLMQHISLRPPSQLNDSLHIRINTSGTTNQPSTRLSITSKGYEYLLLDIQTQVPHHPSSSSSWSDLWLRYGTSLMSV